MKSIDIYRFDCVSVVEMHSTLYPDDSDIRCVDLYHHSLASDTTIPCIWGKSTLYQYLLHFSCSSSSRVLTSDAIDRLWCCAVFHLLLPPAISDAPIYSSSSLWYTCINTVSGWDMCCISIPSGSHCCHAVTLTAQGQYCRTGFEMLAWMRRQLLHNI